MNQVARVEVLGVRIPFRESFSHRSQVREASEGVMVRIETESGHTGWGEGQPRAYVTGETLIVDGGLQLFNWIDFPHV